MTAIATIPRPKINTGNFRFKQKGTAGKGRMSFHDFVTAVRPGYIWYSHVEQLAAVLEKVASGEITRLMVFMPPRHGKSELVSRIFSAYYLYRNPDKWVGISSYAAELAYTFSRAARENYTRAGGELRPDARAVRHWETGKGGGMWAAGVGGPITGKGFHLGIIDDPIKNAEEAGSETIRNKQGDWYDSTFYTRLEPGAAVILIMTRWNEDDLAGRLLNQEEDEPENWHIVHFGAIKEEGEPEYPLSCTVEPDRRKVGEALAPPRYSLEKLNKIARRIGEYFFGALYQQRPRPRSGGMFKYEWFDIVPAVPGGKVHRVRYWDKAGTKDAGAFTAGVRMAVVDGVYYIEDVLMGQWGADQREPIIRQTAALDGQLVKIVVEQEPGSGGKESAEATVKSLPGYVVYKDKVTGDKVLRAEPLAAQAAVRNVKLVTGVWNKRLLGILASFPNGIKDPVDAASGAFNMLVRINQKPQARPQSHSFSTVG